MPKYIFQFTKLISKVNNKKKETEIEENKSKIYLFFYFK